MVLRMTRPTKRPDSSYVQFVQRVPTSVIEKLRGTTTVLELPPAGPGEQTLTVAPTFGSVVRFSLRTADPQLAKARHAAAASQLASLYSAVSAGPQTLTAMQRSALAGEVYRLFVSRFRDDPRGDGIWMAVKAFNRAVREGRISSAPALRPDTAELENAEALQAFGSDFSAGVDAKPKSPTGLEALEARFGWLVDWVLAKHGMVVEPSSRRALLEASDLGATNAAIELKKNARLDYSPDPRAASFAGVEALHQRREPQKPKTIWELFEHWKGEARASASTLQTWRGHFRDLQRFLGHDRAGEITSEMAIGWKDSLVARGLKSADSGFLAAARTIFRHGVQNRLIPSNPFDGVKVRSKALAGEGPETYTTDEIHRLWALAQQETKPFLRWLPWLIITSGARIGEMSQLWGGSIRYDQGTPVIYIGPTPDGGRVKNASSERTIPIHPALIQAGFLKFVASKGDRPLFYAGTGRKAARAAADGERKHPSKSINNQLASWVRSKGFTNKRKAPCHATRHWFKSTLVTAGGYSERVIDRIQGHKISAEAGRYLHVDIPTALKVISALPLPDAPQAEQSGDTNAGSLAA